MHKAIILVLKFIVYTTAVMIHVPTIARNTIEQSGFNEKKTVTLIIDPFSSGALISGELAKYHHACVAIFSRQTFPQSFLASYNADDFIHTFTLTGDMDQLVKEIDAKYHVEAVITGAESGVFLTDRLSSHYKTIGNDLRTSVARRDKFVMQQKIAAAQLHSIPSLITDQFDEVLKWAERQSLEYSHGYIVKPIRSAGTDHVTYCKDLNAVKNTLDYLLGTNDIFGNKNDKVLVQCFVEGEEYVVDAVSVDGQPIITGVLKYNKWKTTEGHLLYDTMDFVSEDTFPERDIVVYTKKVLKALGVQNGPSHNEIMYTQNGPVLIESGARMHGGANPLYCKACSGNSQLEMLPKIYYPYITRYYEDVTQYDYQLKQHMRVVFMMAPQTITTEGMPQFVASVMKLKTYHDNHLDRTQKVIHKTVDLFSCPGFIVLLGSKKSIDFDTKEIRRFEKKLYQ